MGEGLKRNIICITKEEHSGEHQQAEPREKDVSAGHLEIKHLAVATSLKRNHESWKSFKQNGQHTVRYTKKTIHCG